MEFDKSKVYTALNAEELHEGDKVICANNLAALIDTVEGSDGNDNVEVIESILEIMNTYRFSTMDNSSYNLAYLVERRKEPKYIPWTVETCPLKCGDVVIRTSGNKHIEFLIQGIDKSEEVTYGTRVQLNDDWTTIGILFANYTFNGKPCGTEVN